MECILIKTNKGNEKLAAGGYLYTKKSRKGQDILEMRQPPKV